MSDDSDGSGCGVLILLALTAAGVFGYHRWNAFNEAETARLAAQAADLERERRESRMQACIGDAELAYWSDAKLNGAKPVPGHPGIYDAPTRVWERALALKNSKIAECGALYGK